jgi:catechol 2,3-dioxygenase-like lactoylglutathione lyase family enzyme
VIVGIDHLVVVVPDLDAATDLLRARLGIEAGGGGVHPGLGTANRLAWFGDSYLELLGIADPDVAAGSWLGRPAMRMLEERDGGLVAFALASDDLASDVAAAEAAGVALTGSTPGSRVRSDGEVVRWTAAVPTDLAPIVTPFLIEHDGCAAEWRPADRVQRAAEVHPLGGSLRLASLALTVEDPGPVRDAYAAMLGRSPDSATSGTARHDSKTFDIGAQQLIVRSVVRSLDGAAGPLVEIVLTTPDGRAASADLFDCRFAVLRG